MGRIVKAAAVFFIIIGIAAVVMPAYSQEQAETAVVNSVSAEIVSVNAENSSIELKVLKDEVNKVYENQTVTVSPETKILKGEDSLELSGLKTGDKVTVKYNSDKENQKVETISLESPVVTEVK